MRTSLIALTAVFLLSLTACGDTGDQDGGSSPEAVLTAMKAATEADDFAALVPLVVEEQRALLSFAFGFMMPSMAMMTSGMAGSMAGGMAEAFGGEDAAKAAEEAAKAAEAKMKTYEEGMKAIWEKHGIKTAPEEAMGKAMSMQSDPEAAIKFANEMFAGVDHAAFLRDTSAFMEANSDSKDGKSSMSSPMDDLKVSDFKIETDGDTAVATPPDGKNALTLRKIDGRWFMDFVSMMKQR